LPRKPDPRLEQAIVDAALRLLEKQGIEAVTMREVAKAAGTTTPTLYERFRDRDALLDAITNVHRDRLVAMLSSEDSLEKAGAKFLAYCRKCPNAVDLLLKRIASNLKNKKPGPMYELVRSNLIKLHGLGTREAEELTLASSSMVFGTALLCSTLGAGNAAAELERAMLKTMRRLVNSYQK
jgi:AcrR family transcriptional regulator